MTPSPEISLISAHERSRMQSEIQPYESVEDDEVSGDEDEESSVFVRVWSCPGELMVPLEAHTASIIGQGADLNTAGTAPPHALGHEYARSVHPAPTELNISGISPARVNQRVPSSAPAAAPSPLDIDSPARQPKGRTWPCGSLRNCLLLLALTLITAGAWTFAGMCIHHNIDSSDALDIAWEQRICTVLGLTEQPDLNPDGKDCCLFSVSANVAGVPVQRRLLHRQTLSLEDASDSGSATGVRGDSLFVDETEEPGVPVNVSAPGPAQEAGEQTDVVQIISAQACAGGLQRTPCDAFLAQITLDATNSYQCFVHLESSRLSFAEVSKSAHASCFQRGSFALTNALPYGQGQTGGADEAENSCVDALSQGKIPQTHGASILEGRTALITGIVIAVLLTLALFAVVLMLRQTESRAQAGVVERGGTDIESSPGPELQHLNPSSGRNSVSYDTLEPSSSKVKVGGNAAQHQEAIHDTDSTLPQGAAPGTESSEGEIERRHSV